MPRPSARRRTGGEPVPLSGLIGLALPDRLQRRLLGLELLQDAWREAAPDELVTELEPVGFERGVLRLHAADPSWTRLPAARRADLARRLLEAAGLPRASLRIRIVADR